MQKNSDKNENTRIYKIIILVALLIITVSLSVAYIALSNQLKIQGTKNVLETIDINIPRDSTYTNTGGDGTISYETESNDGLMAIKNLKVTLRKPGDFAELTVPVKNSGTALAHVAYVSGFDGILRCEGIGAYKENDEKLICGDINNNMASVKYSIYYDNTLLTNGLSDIRDINLKTGDTKEVKVRLEYLSTATKIPNETVLITLPEIDFIFQQSM